MDVGQWNGPSWSRAGVDAIAAEQLGEQLGEQLPEREPGERVMICYQHGFTMPGTVAIVRPGEATTVVVDDQYGGTVGLVGIFPPALLRTILAEQCIPAELIASVSAGRDW